MTAPPPTPAQYTTGMIRRNTSSLSCAVRTGLPTVDGTLDWIVMTTNYGAYYGNWGEVGGSNWIDVGTGS